MSDLPQTLSAALAAKGYDALTPVQEAVTAPELAGLDLLVSAQTGSGKTVGFGLAIAPDLLDETGHFPPAATPLALVIAPTRELALQVRREFDWLYGPAGIRTASAVGGMDARTERRNMERGAHVVVATPGRLRDHIDKGVVDLSAMRAVVLDEADEMLDMGFAEDLAFILDHAPEDRRTLLFSATVPKGIAKLAQTYQKEDARRLELGSKNAQHADITYQALNVAPSDIEKAIINILRYHDPRSAIIFANTRAMVARLAAKFSNRGFATVSLSGELSQSERSHALQALRDGRARVCIATDVAARGIDLPNLELVIHADLPSNAEALLHRSGRTGRAGRKGTSVLIVPGRQRSKAQRLLKFAKLNAEWGAPPSADEVQARDEERILADPGWAEPLSEEEQAFATRLLDGRSAEQIAAAFLRLHRERHSAPEILGPVPEPGPREKRAPREAQDFGPSTWFSLSLGRKQRAEPRWLLPMICRNTGITKDAIGAIRVQYQETFVEVLSSAVPGIKAELGEAMEIEQGARLTELEGVPDFEASPKGPPSDRYGPKSEREDRPRTPRGDRDGKPRKARGAWDDKPRKPREDRGDKPRKPRGEWDDKPRKPRGEWDDKPRKPRGDGAGKPGKPGRDAPWKDKPKGDAPRKPKGEAGARDFDKGPKGGGKPPRDKGPKGGGQPPRDKGAPKKPKFKGAADPSQPMGDRKGRLKGKGDGSAKRVKPRVGKGPDARPMRKPSR
ncbi:MAG: DEAD/DEAH box helicase [Silicimonas sp.]|nr:DEAD/DEAH box helicase [Silicimonas sp.]